MRVAPPRSFYSFAALLLGLFWPTAVFAQGGTSTPEAAPGLPIPSTVVPWALDVVDGQPALVPVHHASVTMNRHTGKNIAGELAGSFLYHPEMTTELQGTHARTQLHTSTPVLYFHVEQDMDPEEPGKAGDRFAIQLVPAKLAKDRRVVTTTTFNALTTRGKHKDDAISTTTDVLPGDWYRLAPKTPLAAGEYVLLWQPMRGEEFAVTVYPFGIDPKAPVSSEAVRAGGGAGHGSGTAILTQGAAPSE